MNDNQDQGGKVALAEISKRLAALAAKMADLAKKPVKPIEPNDAAKDDGSGKET
ncbi:hypothetical protein [Agrobacterium rubi]|uniref:Uncharacterized protein n=1 Tax=Agrobacterium rubi TaxID=28099 RepID=A0AAE7URV1_9HYPH|nr:hypothetical protein [Agrobacterium rubi]NTE87844.1 hypothetical protein [Agrobacterium rubi]NTF05158.1 hypothetical protein [Agrobacterium rubi]NTF37937.1 hypothetical protein [Agrobacterium rubi]QTG01797.1 hypothetical protein G6M88_15040 [Agrobacterium rubi]